MNENQRSAEWCTAMNLAANLGGSQQNQDANSLGFGSQQAIPEGLAHARAASLNHALGGAQQTMSAEFMNRAAGYGPGLASGQIGGARDKGEIESQIDALDNQLKSLQIIASQISDKFAPILSGANNNTGNLGNSPPLHTLLGGRLYTMNAQAAILRESLQDIIGRCKL